MEFIIRFIYSNPGTGGTSFSFMSIEAETAEAAKDRFNAINDGLTGRIITAMYQQVNIPADPIAEEPDPMAQPE